MKILKIFFYKLFLLILITTNLIAYENRIIVKINSEIITSIDIKKETDYLKLFNKNLKNVDPKLAYEIAKNSITREKIKMIELKKNFEELKIDPKYLDQLINSTFTRIGFSSEEDFKNSLLLEGLDFDEIKNKIVIEALWNELIIYKFASKLKINEASIKENLINKEDKYKYTYELSEIMFEINNNDELEQKSKIIKDTIEKEGFENAALAHSISRTADMGGKIGLIEFEALNDNIKNWIKDLKIGEYSNPILTPSGFLILKINDIKKTIIESDIDLEIKKIVNAKKNQQLNQYSNSYYNKIKKDINVENL